MRQGNSASGIFSENCVRGRVFRFSALIFSVLSIGLLYALAVNIIGFGIPCIFRTVTGLKCPGCGVSEMCLSLLRLDFSHAFRANPAIMLLTPAWIFIFADISVRYIRTGSKVPGKAANVTAIFAAVVLVAFGVIRNFV